jgi:hypothetical protein
MPKQQLLDLAKCRVLMFEYDRYQSRLESGRGQAVEALVASVIHKLVPAEGSITGGTEVTLLGSGFYPGMEVGCSCLNTTDTSPGWRAGGVRQLRHLSPQNVVVVATVLPLCG